MTTSDLRHKRIFGRQAKVAASVWGVILALTLASGLKQGLDNHQINQARHAAVSDGQFWRVVAGTDAPHSTSSRDTLAAELRDRLGEHDPNAVKLPEPIERFKAANDAYGGVESQLGLNPFNSSRGLSDDTLQKLLEIKQGKVEDVIKAEISAHQSNGLQLTPFGLPLWLWLGFVYLGGGTLAAVWAVRRDANQNDYSPKELNWKVTGGTTADAYKRMSRAISPLYFLVVIPLKNRHGGSPYDDALEKIGLADKYHELRQLLQDVNRLPVAEQAAARAELQGLIDLIDQQVGNYLGTDRTFRQLDADSVRKRIEEARSSIGEPLHALKDARQELDNLTGLNSSSTPAPHPTERRRN